MLDAYGITDPGCVRQNNEDYYLIQPAAGLYLVADGMGGAAAGETASKLAGETVLEVVRQRPAEGPELLERAFREANRRIRSRAADEPSLKGMGTTLVAVLDQETEFIVASVGDSRCYQFVDGTLRPVTVDQSWAQEVGRRLGIGADRLKKHPMRHLLTMAVGSFDSLRIHHYTLPKRPGMQLLLSSDGLHGVVPEEIISAALNREQSLAEKCHYLVEAARGAGGPDNITVVLLRTADNE